MNMHTDMGSLMSGWDSPVLASKSGMYKRNRSLTKEEIEAYWKSKQKTIEEHLKEIPALSEATLNQEIVKEEELYGKKVFQRSSSLPLENIRKEGFVINVYGTTDDETSIDKLVKKNGWWTRSNWAFLNEPPVTEGASNSYVTQFHVANLASSKSKSHDGDGIAIN